MGLQLFTRNEIPTNFALRETHVKIAIIVHLAHDKNLNISKTTRFCTFACDIRSHKKFYKTVF